MLAAATTSAQGMRTASTKEAALELVTSWRAKPEAVLLDGFEPREGHIYTVTRAISARVNQNFDGFRSAELKKAYRTFLGKPCFVNHANEDPERARGRVVGARYAEQGVDKYIEVIQEVNAAKYPRLAKEIADGGLDSVSMGCVAQVTVCSVCDNEATDMFEMCAHVLNRKGEYLPREAEPELGRKVLCYEDCRDLGFFELSYVFDPADETAVVSNVVTAARRALAYGETEAPVKVDTLRDEKDEDGFKQYVQSPAELTDPDLNKAKNLPEAEESEDPEKAKKDKKSDDEKKKESAMTRSVPRRRSIHDRAADRVARHRVANSFQPGDKVFDTAWGGLIDEDGPGTVVSVAPDEVMVQWPFGDAPESTNPSELRHASRTAAVTWHDESDLFGSPTVQTWKYEGTPPTGPQGHVIEQIDGKIYWYVEDLYSEFEYAAGYASSMEEGKKAAEQAISSITASRTAADDDKKDSDDDEKDSDDDKPDFLKGKEKDSRRSEAKNLVRRAQEEVNRRRTEGHPMNRRKADQSRNDQGVAEDTFITQTPPAEPVETGEGPTDEPNQTDHVAARRFARFRRWVAHTEGRDLRTASPKEIRRWAMSFAREASVEVADMYPHLGQVLQAARQREEIVARRTRRAEKDDEGSKGGEAKENPFAKKDSEDDEDEKDDKKDDDKKESARTRTRRQADSKLDVAAPDGRVDVERPTADTTDDEAQASQFDRGDFGDNAGDDIADPDLSTDQNWAPGDGKKRGSVLVKAGELNAFRLAEAYIKTGLAREEDKYKLGNQFAEMAKATVLDRIALLERVLSVQSQRQTTGSVRGSAVRNAIPQYLSQRAASAGVQREAAADLNSPDNDFMLHL